MSIPDRTVTKISWRDICPWLIIFRTLPIAASFTVVAFATLGVVMTPIGWLIGEGLFLTVETRQQDPFFNEFVEVSRSPYRGIFDASSRPENYLELFGARLSGARAVYERTVLPVRQLFQGGLGLRKFCYFLFGTLWMIAVWSFAGCCISRFAMLKLTREETLPIDEVWRFGIDRWINCVTAFMVCFAVVVLLTIPGFLIGLFLASNIGSTIGSLIWIIVAICSTLMSLVLFGLMFAWPIIVTSVSAENQNALDAVTRSFAYVFQRPLNYAMYGLLALAYGGFCWLIISQIATTSINLTFWSTSWGANVASSDRIDEFVGPQTLPGDLARGVESVSPTVGLPERPTTLRFSTKVIRFWNGMISTVAVAFLYGLFWCMASAVYLLLRFDVDETEMDEVFIDEESRAYNLPPLKSDENGIPQIQPLEEFEKNRQQQKAENIDALGE